MSGLADKWEREVDVRWVVTEQTDRSFSDGEAVDSIETEKSRIVLHELEQGWWVLAVGYMYMRLGWR